MQFHLNGFRPGDPAILEPFDSRQLDGDQKVLPPTADVVIIGCGPAGLTLATQLATFPAIKTVIVDQKSGPLEVGQADGIACRTMEMFEAFGFVEKVLKESYWVNETTFWKPDPKCPQRIARSGRTKDVEEGLSHMPHVILNQARIHDFYLERMANSSTRLSPFYGRKLLQVTRDAIENALAGEANPISHYPIKLNFETEEIRARYVIGCDGARSAVRQSMGLKLEGDSANKAWGVMDVLVQTDFPDIRFKALIQSESEGSIVLIPREGGYMVRLYVELEKLRPDERVSARNISIEQLIAAAQRIFHPYKLEVKQVAWWSVYEIGQRLCNRFDDSIDERSNKRLPRIFIAGDACHTHSPKAGQGMNVSMQDAFNLGWKLASVLIGQSTERVLATYSEERQVVAQTLIEFDREWAALLSKTGRNAAEAQDQDTDAAAVQSYFVQHGRYTAGTATRYQKGLLIGDALHQGLAQGFLIGTRFHSAPVVRIGDAKHIELGSAFLADGRWRIVLFASEQESGQAGGFLDQWCDWFSTSQDSPLKRHCTGPDIDSLFDVRAVFQQPHHDVALPTLPSLLFPKKGLLGLNDYEKAYCAVQGEGQNIYQIRKINRDAGCVVIVRPDQYIAQVLPLQDRTGLIEYFSSFLVTQ